MSDEQDKTKVDDLLLEMIQPKVREIEEKFSRGEGLSNEDINTLLLKSQYNHINHLDHKLNEVTASVVLLTLNFSELKADFAQHQTEIQKMINSSMRWYVASISLLVIGLKFLDLLISK